MKVNGNDHNIYAMQQGQGNSSNPIAGDQTDTNILGLQLQGNTDGFSQYSTKEADRIEKQEKALREKQQELEAELIAKEKQEGALKETRKGLEEKSFASDVKANNVKEVRTVPNGVEIKYKDGNKVSIEPRTGNVTKESPDGETLKEHYVYNDTLSSINYTKKGDDKEYSLVPDSSNPAVAHIKVYDNSTESRKELESYTHTFADPKVLDSLKDTREKYSSFDLARDAAIKTVETRCTAEEGLLMCLEERFKTPLYEDMLKAMAKGVSPEEAEKIAAKKQNL